MVRRTELVITRIHLLIVLCLHKEHYDVIVCVVQTSGGSRSQAPPSARSSVLPTRLLLQSTRPVLTYNLLQPNRLGTGLTECILS